MFFKKLPLTNSLADEPQFRFPGTRRWTTWNGYREQEFQQQLESFQGRPVHFLEIGSYEGASAIWLFRNILTHPESTLTCIDNDKFKSRKNLEHNLEAAGVRSRAKFHWIDSQNLRSFVPDNHFDFVYVDGSHAAPNVLYDVVNAYLICKPGGLVGCDDYLFDIPEDSSVPKPAIDTFLTLLGSRVEVVRSDYQLWFRKCDG
jgi:predicted O-methyltransferase YrrM